MLKLTTILVPQALTCVLILEIHVGYKWALQTLGISLFSQSLAQSINIQSHLSIISYFVVFYIIFMIFLSISAFLFHILYDVIYIRWKCPRWLLFASPFSSSACPMFVLGLFSLFQFFVLKVSLCFPCSFLSLPFGLYKILLISFHDLIPTKSFG